MRSIECLRLLDDDFPLRRFCGAELRQLFLDVAFDEQRYEVADRSALEPGVLLEPYAIDPGALKPLSSNTIRGLPRASDYCGPQIRRFPSPSRAAFILATNCANNDILYASIFACWAILCGSFWWCDIEW